MPASPRGVLEDDDQVHVRDQADGDRLYNKGFAGTPRKGGGLRLSLTEATWLVGDRRLEVVDTDGAPLRFPDLFARGVAAEPGFEIRFFAYQALRSRACVTKHANRRSLDFLVYRQGDAPPRAEPAWLAGAHSERDPLTTSSFLGWLEEAAAEGAALMAVVVDEEGDTTYYEVGEADPRGQAPPDPPAPVAGDFLKDRVVVWGQAAAEALHGERFLGRRIPGGLQLSLVEAAALVDEGALVCAGFWDQAEAVQPDLRLRLAVYRDLRARGLFVKTGFKFGTHFRAYADDPRDHHAPWLVHAVPHDWVTTWPELSRAVRLAHAVRKTLLLSIADPSGDGRVRHVTVSRFRP